MNSFAPTAFTKLNGLFAVYKPPEKTLKQLHFHIKECILRGLNSMEQLPPPKKVVFEKSKVVPAKSDNCELAKQHLQDRVVLKEDWFYHPAVQGPTYSNDDLKLHWHSGLEDFASGVQVFGIGDKGEELLNKLDNYASTNVYDVHGRFGEASIGFADTGRVVDRSTYDHVYPKAVARLLNMIAGRYRTVNVKASDIDLSSQHAYELASHGILRPTNDCPYVIYHAKLKHFAKPHFSVELTCFNEELPFLQSIIHEIGLEMQTTALCTKVRRSRSFIFHAYDQTTLLSDYLSTDAIINAIESNQDAVEQALNNKSIFLTNLDEIKQPKEGIIHRSVQMI